MGSRLSEPVGGAPAWTIVLLALAAIVLVPWTVLLSAQLPARAVARHWDVAWAGFDAGIATVLIATVIAAIRESTWLAGLAMAAAAMLVCDAWFDVVTSSTRLDFWLAIASAFAVELPLAFLCVIVSRAAVDRRVAAGRGGETR
jgi:hypothetical protein